MQGTSPRDWAYLPAVAIQVRISWHCTCVQGGLLQLPDFF